MAVWAGKATTCGEKVTHAGVHMVFVVCGCVVCSVCICYMCMHVVCVCICGMWCVCLCGVCVYVGGMHGMCVYVVGGMCSVCGICSMR